MTDTPMTQDTHDTLIERLVAGQKICNDYHSGKRGDDLYVTRLADELLGLAVSRLKQSQWRPIEDIPEEWKDGRPVDLIINGEREVNNSYRLCGHANGKSEEGLAWVCQHNLWIKEDITHAMLPPQSPQ